MTVENCLIEGNVARGGSNITAGGRTALVAGGGGIFNSDQGVLVLRGCTIRGNRALGGSNNIGTGVEGEIGTAFGGGLGNVGAVTITDCLFERNEARGGSGNRGSGGAFQYVGSASGGAIFTAARNMSGAPASLSLDDVTVRNNRAVGGDGNAQGGFVGMGIGGSEIPASVFQAANPVFILLFGLAFSALWLQLGSLGIEPSTPVKFSLGLVQLGLGYGALWYGCTLADARGMVGVSWLLLGYALHTTGELCISPVGLSMVTKLSPGRLVSTVHMSAVTSTVVNG